jgi:hypothetical protein
LWLFGALCARADDAVILFERDRLRPGLCAALRIQLADAAKVRCEAEPPDTALPERIANAAARVKEHEARIGLFLERDPDPQLVRMYIVAAESDQAVVAIERIEDRPEPDVDRSLALKVRDAFFVIEQVTERPKTPLAAVVAPVPSAPPPNAEALSRPEAVAQPALSSSRYEVWLDVGGGLSFVSATRGLFAGVVGLAWAREGLRLELGVGARFLSQHTDTQGGARVSENEQGPLLSLRVLLERTRFAIGGLLSPTVIVSQARGSERGGSGDDRKILAGVGLGLDLRVRLLPAVSLRFAPGVEWLIPHQRYAVSEQVVTDLGRARLLLPLSLFVSIPLREGAAR